MSDQNFVELDQQGSNCRWHTFDSAPAVQQAVLERVLATAARAVRERGAFRLVLAGGTSPRHVYESLARSEADWANWHIYYGDERCLPPDHAERNSLMAERAWLEASPIPRQQIHPMPAELGPVAAAQAYSAVLKDVGLFDLVLLGLGEDGHTASLFPGHPLEVGAAAAIPVFNSPKPPPERVSLSASRLAATRQLVYLVTGMGKREAVGAWRTGGAGKPIPAAQIKPVCGVDVMIEAALLA